MADTSNECCDDVNVEKKSEVHADKTNNCELLKGGECGDAASENGLLSDKVNLTKNNDGSDHKVSDDNAISETCAGTTDASLTAGIKRKTDDDEANQWNADETKKVKKGDITNDIADITEPITETGVCENNTNVSPDNKEQTADIPKDDIKKYGSEEINEAATEAIKTSS